MYPGVMQDTSQVDEARSVQLQFLDGGAPGWRQAEQEGKVLVPREVIAPTHLSRMEKTRCLTIEWVPRVDGREFAIVALLAGESQVFHDIATAA